MTTEQTILGEPIRPPLPPVPITLAALGRMIRRFDPDEEPDTVVRALSWQLGSQEGSVSGLALPCAIPGYVMVRDLTFHCLRGTDPSDWQRVRRGLRALADRDAKAREAAGCYGFTVTGDPDGDHTITPNKFTPPPYSPFTSGYYQ